ncbi:MAG: hypothetical protein ACRC9P_03445 [Bacteroides sp.]
MWNKLILITLIAALHSSLQAQVFLGQSQVELSNYLKTQGSRVSSIQTTKASMQFQLKQEDERNRLFDTTYYLTFQNNKCVVEVKKVERDDYWLSSLVDLIQVKKGKPQQEQILNYDGVPLFSTYLFSEFRLDLRQENEYLWIRFTSQT